MGLLYLGKWNAAGTPLLTYLVNAYLFWIALFFAKALPRLDRGKRRRIYQFLEIITVITLITTMIGSLRYPNASRILAGEWTAPIPSATCGETWVDMASSMV